MANSQDPIKYYEEKIEPLVKELHTVITKEGILPIEAILACTTLCVGFLRANDISHQSQMHLQLLLVQLYNTVEQDRINKIAESN